MKIIKISIIIPVFNGEKFIDRCLNSIFNQNFQEVEVIIVNDGSNDGSEEKLENWARKNKNIILINKSNEGVSSARNIALEIAKGEYILNIDIDDYIEEEYLYNIYKYSKQNNLDILITDYYEKDSRGKKYIVDLDLEGQHIIPDDYINKILSNNFKGFTWNKLIRRELYFIPKERYRKDLVLMEDLLLLIKIINKSKKIGKLDKAYYNYVQHQTNTTKNMSAKHFSSVIRVFDELKKIYFNDPEKLILLNAREILCLTEIILQIKEKLEIKKIEKEYLEKIKKIKLTKKIKISMKMKFFIQFFKKFNNKSLLNLILQIYKNKNFNCK